MEYTEFEETFGIEEATLAWKSYCISKMTEGEEPSLWIEKEYFRWKCKQE